MSRCGSCDLYNWQEMGVYCPGNLCDIECAKKIQDYIYEIKKDIKKIIEETYQKGYDEGYDSGFVDGM